MSESELDTNLRQYFEKAHATGALDAKTKELIHLALVLAADREQSAVTHFANARAMGVSDEEIEETIHLAASVAAGSLLAMARRALKVVDSEAKWQRPDTRA